MGGRGALLRVDRLVVCRQVEAQVKQWWIQHRNDYGAQLRRVLCNVNWPRHSWCWKPERHPWDHEKNRRKLGRRRG